jgi:RNA polymerase sigma factor for flagellar operon FliA
MIARHLSSRLPNGAAADADDLTQAATLGLRDAIATYDPSRGIKFEHYCGPRVRGAAIDFLRSLDWAPRLLRSRINRVQEMSLQLEMQSGTLPTDEQVSSALNMPLEEYQATRREHAAPQRLRLSAGGDSDGHQVDLSDLVDDHSIDPAREAQRADLREFLVKGLAKVEREVTTLYYYEGLSLSQIGRVLHLCESRVSQIHQSVLARLRERIPRIGGASLDD